MHREGTCGQSGWTFSKRSSTPVRVSQNGFAFSFLTAQSSVKPGAGAVWGRRTPQRASNNTTVPTPPHSLPSPALPTLQPPPLPPHTVHYPSPHPSTNPPSEGSGVKSVILEAAARLRMPPELTRQTARRGQIDSVCSAAATTRSSQ